MLVLQKIKAQINLCLWQILRLFKFVLSTRWKLEMLLKESCFHASYLVVSVRVTHVPVL